MALLTLVKALLLVFMLEGARAVRFQVRAVSHAEERSPSAEDSPLTTYDGHSQVDGADASRNTPRHELDSIPTEARQVLLVTTVLERPYMMMKTSGGFLTGNDRYEGFLADLLRELSDRAGFDYVIRLCQDGLHGAEGENNTWSGMIGAVHRGEADLAAGAITMTESRSRIIQFTDPFMTFQSAAILKRPRNKKHERVPRKARPKLRTLEDLYQHGIQYGVVSGSQTAMLFETSSDPILRAMWLKMVTSWPSAFVYNTQEGIQRSEHEEYAFITDSSLAQYVTTRKPCHLYKTGNFLNRQYYAFVVKRSDEGNILRERLNVYLNEMNSDGTLGSYMDEWWASECDSKRDVKDRETVTKQQPRTTVSPWRHATAQTGELSSAAVQLKQVISSIMLSICICVFIYQSQ